MLNSWKENLGNNEEERFYLNALNQNLKQDTLELSFVLERVESTDSTLRIMMNEMYNPKLDSFSVNIATAMMSIASILPESSTWENLKSSGKLVLIRNTELIDSLFIYYNSMSDVTKNLSEAIETYSRNSFGPYFL